MTVESSTPPANVYEAHGQLSVALPVPGAHPDNISVVVRPGRLQVLAECKYPQESQSYHRREWMVGAWRLDLALPLHVDPAGARATLNFGVLVVMAPVARSAPPGDAEARPVVAQAPSR